MGDLTKDEIQHIVDRELLHLDGYKSTMPIFDDYDPAIYGKPVPSDQFILTSGHIDQTAIVLANMADTPLVILGGAPGIGKTHQVGGFMEDRFIHIQYSPMDDFYDMPLSAYRVKDEPYVGERRVNKARKAKARINNRLARKARRAGR